jgi:1,4-dihydroxy-2-naphthoate polyprenyltransferase
MTSSPSPVQKWIICIRPFSLPASTMPVVFGTVCAVVIGGADFNPLLFAMAFLGMLLLHCGANVLSDIHDFNRGLDVEPTPVSGGVVRGLITKPEALKGALIFFSLGSVLGLLIAWLTTPLILVVGIIGVLIGAFYTAGPVALKYRGLGDLSVFLNFGILGSLGAWIVQTGSFSWIPVIGAIPMALLVIGILHANNWRDMASDRKGGIVTVASLLGDHGSLHYYRVLLFLPFILVLLFMAAPRFFPDFPFHLPLTSAIVFIGFRHALALHRKALLRATPAEPMDFITLDGATGQFNLLFGLLYTGSLLLHSLLVMVFP